MPKDRMKRLHIPRYCQLNDLTTLNGLTWSKAEIIKQTVAAPALKTSREMGGGGIWHIIFQSKGISN